MLRAELEGKSWEELSSAFLTENDGCLPLLTPEAYHAFLPAWLVHGLSDPEGGPASMALINMSLTMPSARFTREQRQALVDAVRFIHTSDAFSVEDPHSIDCYNAIRAAWSPR
jgi:hypothetical protein